MADFYAASARAANRTQVTGESDADARAVARSIASTPRRALASRPWSCGLRPSPTSSMSSSPTTCPTRRSSPRSRPSASDERTVIGSAATAAAGARVGAMTDRSTSKPKPSDVASRRATWEAERLDPALQPRARAQGPLLDDQRHAHRRPVRTVVAGRGRRSPHRPAGRSAVHARHPPERLSEPPLDDADVRRVRRGRGHQRPLPAAARRRPDRPVDRLRHADALRLRHRRRRGGRRVRDVRRRGQLAGRHGGAARRPAARTRVDVDDDQLAGRADLGDVHRGRREGGRPARPTRGHDPERHPQGVHRPEGVPVPARAVDAPRDRHDRVRDARAAALEHDLDLGLPHPRGRLDRGPGAGVHDRRRDGLRRGRPGARVAHRRLRPAAVVLLQLALGLLRGDREVPRRAGGSGTTS